MTLVGGDQYPEKGWLLLTNDDGIEALGLRLLVQALHQAGHPIIVFAPAENQSATSMSINLNSPMKLRQRYDLVEEWGLCAATDTSIKIWDLENKNILDELIKKDINEKKSGLPWCVSLTWSADGNTLFAGS